MTSLKKELHEVGSGWINIRFIPSVKTIRARSIFLLYCTPLLVPVFIPESWFHNHENPPSTTFIASISINSITSVPMPASTIAMEALSRPISISQVCGKGDMLYMSRLEYIATSAGVGHTDLLAQNCSCLVTICLISASSFAHQNNCRAGSCRFFLGTRWFQSSWLHGVCIHVEDRRLIETISVIYDRHLYFWIASFSPHPKHFTMKGICPPPPLRDTESNE